MDHCSWNGKRAINLVCRWEELVLNKRLFIETKQKNRNGCTQARSPVERAGSTYFNDVVRSSVHVEVLDSHCQLVGSLASEKVLAD